LQTVARFAEVWEAHLLRGRLRSEDIPAFVAFGFHMGNAWHFGLALGGALVQVPNGFEDEAQAVLRRINTGMVREELEAQFGPIGFIACPHCGATDYRKVRPWPMTLLAVLIVVTTGFAVLPNDNEYRCRVCGTRWKPDPDLLA
jgi:hypothetical protein